MPRISMAVLMEAEAGVGWGGHAGISLARDQVLAEAGEALGTEQPRTDLSQWG